MALSSAFRERLQHMEQTRDERLSHLQAERELQRNKSQVLAFKLENIRSMERRCLILDRQIALQNFKISALKSEVESLDSKYEAISQELSEVEELEEFEEDKQRFYDLKTFEMKEFKQNVENFKAECGGRVEELRVRVNELKSTLTKLQSSNGSLNNLEIAAAETSKAELLAMKEKLTQSICVNYQMKAHLQKQLQDMLITGSPAEV
ncbi:uncharacterized protein LOC110819280 isoform X2 [Carica papaya]|uniref:uncharacterized protein LOC110819280 isoform X2 n=1 Tax=Carica papaya TaxID=3649 RepID=UPI000B8D0030|nr:uncharacterized protein LOC110819280 isoform X2 [Carica papaya]